MRHACGLFIQQQRVACKAHALQSDAITTCATLALYVNLYQMIYHIPWPPGRLLKLRSLKLLQNLPAGLSRTS